MGQEKPFKQDIKEWILSLALAFVCVLGLSLLSLILTKSFSEVLILATILLAVAFSIKTLLFK